MTNAFRADVVIVGGGVAGLWAGAVLRRLGYACLLLECEALGGGQTVASQGIIHGGMKYALTGSPSGSSKAIARMPEIWRACLDGLGQPDLRGVRVLSGSQQMFTSGGLGARVAGMAASKVIRTSVGRIARADFPAGFAGAPRGVDVYRVDEPVLEPVSIVEALRDAGPPALLAADVVLDDAGVACTSGGRAVSIRSGCVVLAAGAGNEAIIDRAGLTRVFAGTGRVMQRRALHMAMVRAEGLPMLYAHAVGTSPKPIATITSQRDACGRTVWYVGGAISEDGVSLGRTEFIEMARSRLGGVLPWISLDGAEWAALRIDRAEPAIASGERPDEPYVVQREGAPGVVLVWPTKLAFAPAAGEQIARCVERRVATPSGDIDGDLAGLELAPVAALPWDRGDITWS